MVREVARGGMGAVFVARHPGLDREVAVKLLLAEAATPQGLARFEAEAQALGRLDHPGIVTVHGFGLEGRHPYLVMELVDGEALDSVLKRDGPLGSTRAAEVLVGLCEAIESAHQAGILHRDLKPANVLLDRTGQPRVTDFGIAKDEQRETLTRTGQVLGTPAYMSPEQAGGEREQFGPRTDVYGLGATLFALLAGVPPFRGASAMNIVTAVLCKPHAPLPESVDPALAAICERCLEKEPEARYASAAELGEALRSYLGGEDPGPAPPSRTWSLGVLGLLIAAAVAGGVFSQLGSGPSPDPTEQGPASEPLPPQPTRIAEPDWSALNTEARYREAWRFLNLEPAPHGKARARAQAIRDDYWLRVPLARLHPEVGDTEDVLGCFVPGDPSQVLVMATGKPGLLWWSWGDPGVIPEVQPLAGPPFKDAPLMPTASTVWLMRNGTKTQEAPVLELLQGLQRGELGEPQPVGGQGSGRVHASALSPDGRLLAAGGTATRPRLYDARSGALLGDLEDAKEPAVGTRYLSFSPDGTRVLGTAGAGDTGYLQVWDASTRELVFQRLLDHKCNRPFSNADASLVGACHLTGATIFRPGEERPAYVLPFGEGEDLLSARDGAFLLGDAYVLLSGGQVEDPKRPGRLVLWRLDGAGGPEIVRTTKPGGAPDSRTEVCRGRMTLSPDRRFLLVGSLKGMIEVYEGDASPPSREALQGR